MTEESSQPAASGPAPEAAPVTGDPRVDGALAALGSLGEEPGPGHVEAFEEAHRELHTILDEVGEQDNPAHTGRQERR